MKRQAYCSTGKFCAKTIARGKNKSLDYNANHNHILLSSLKVSASLKVHIYWNETIQNAFSFKQTIAFYLMLCHAPSCCFTHTKLYFLSSLHHYSLNNSQMNTRSSLMLYHKSPHLWSAYHRGTCSGGLTFTELISPNRGITSRHAKAIYPGALWQTDWWWRDSVCSLSKWVR